MSLTDFQDFLGPVAPFQDFPVLENATVNFQDFPGFSGPVQTQELGRHIMKLVSP